MEGKKIIKISTIMALLGAVAIVLSACASGIAQADYDGVRQQLTAKEQELALVKNQMQQPAAAAREPKRLEAKITIDMGEDKGSGEMFFATPEGAKGGPFRLPAGKSVGIRFVNTGEKTHEFFFGRTVKIDGGNKDGYDSNLFEQVAADLFVYKPVSGKMAMVEIGGAHFEEVEVDPGAEVWLRVNFPTNLKGEWEIGCFVQEPNEKGHYDQGMHAKLIIE